MRLYAAVWTLATIAALESGPVWAHREGFEVVPDAEEVEAFEAIEAVPVDSSGGEAANPWLLLLGRLHIPLVHFPIAWLILALGAALARRRFPDRVGEWDLGLLTLAFLSMLPAVITGLIHEEHIDDPNLHGLIESHERMALVTAGVTAAAVVARFLGERRKKEGWRKLAVVLTLVAAGLIAWVGHLGGSIVYGPAFFALP